ncbi:N-acetylglucosamine kinase [Microbacterium sp. 179-I 3D4 NHS]|uniref:N-acetylglucosamine kinase n=1 Tax=Microbacterium sp. 179-I 3D4 NHS TaxID=3142381 RepID=UPI0039A09C5D
MTLSPRVLAIDLGKTRCRLVAAGQERRSAPEGTGAPGLTVPGGVTAALEAIRPLLDGADVPAAALGVGAAGAWAAPAAAAELARLLAREYGAPTVVASDVVTAHIGALGGRDGVLLIAGTGAAALGIDAEGARLIDGWGPDVGDLGSGSWLGRETLRAVLRATDGLGPATALTEAVVPTVGPASAIVPWVGQEGPLARRLATLAPLVLDAARDGDEVARAIAAEAVALLTASAFAASASSSEVVLHGGLTAHDWFRGELTTALQSAGRRVRPAAGDALDGALLLATRFDLHHERFVHRAE